MGGWKPHLHSFPGLRLTVTFHPPSPLGPGSPPSQRFQSSGKSSLWSAAPKTPGALGTVLPLRPNHLHGGYLRLPVSPPSLTLRLPAFQLLASTRSFLSSVYLCLIKIIPFCFV